jgi:hypothetical protein
MEKAAKAMGYTLSDAITIANGNETIPIIGQQIRWLKTKLETITRDLEIQSLRQRTAEANAGKTNHRKDFQGILEDGIDHDSTTALIKLKVKTKKVKEPSAPDPLARSAMRAMPQQRRVSDASNAQPTHPSLASGRPRAGSQEEQRHGYPPDLGMLDHEEDQFDEDPFGHGGGMDCVSETAITNTVIHRGPPEERDPGQRTKPKARNIVMDYIQPPIGDIARRWWEVLITGAIRTCERLHSAGIKYKGTDQTVPAECQICEGNIVENNDHIFWGSQNPKQNEIRKIFVEILGKMANWGS